MKHDARLAPQIGAPQAPTAQIGARSEATPAGDLALVAVLGVLSDGGPLLAGRQADVVLTPLPPGAATGLLAVCKPFGGGLAVLGYVGRAEAVRAVGGLAGQGDHLSLGIGRAEIRLHADGRIRLRGTDVALEASGRMALTGAWIDLN